MNFKIPNLFKRDGNVIVWGFYDEPNSIATYYDKSNIDRLDIKVSDRFNSLSADGDSITNAKITLSVGNINKASFDACPIFIQDSISGSITISYVIKDVLDFFFRP